MLAEHHPHQLVREAQKERTDAGTDSLLPELSTTEACDAEGITPSSSVSPGAAPGASPPTDVEVAPARSGSPIAPLVGAPGLPRAQPRGEGAGRTYGR